VILYKPQNKNNKKLILFWILFYINKSFLNNKYLIFINNNLIENYLFMGIGNWGLGIGDWGLGPIPNPQSPIPIHKTYI